MKTVFSINRSSESIDMAIFWARTGIAVLMLIHGISKAALFNEMSIQFMDFMGLGPEMSLGLAILAEMGCSVLILLGLGTRIAVIPLIITMLVAVFVVHSGDPFAHKEMGLHYLLVYIMLLLTGSGKYSLDRLISAKG